MEAEEEVAEGGTKRQVENVKDSSLENPLSFESLEGVEGSSSFIEGGLEMKFGRGGHNECNVSV